MVKDAPLFAKILSITPSGDNLYTVVMQGDGGQHASVVIRFTRPGSSDYPFGLGDFSRVFRTPHAPRVAAHFAYEFQKGTPMSFPLDVGDISVSGFFEDPLRKEK